MAPRALPVLGLIAHSVLGGRFKKEIVVDGQSYLLLIRDEGGPPELQVMPQRRGAPFPRSWLGPRRVARVDRSAGSA